MKVIRDFNLDSNKDEQDVEIPFGSEIIKIGAAIGITDSGPTDFIKIWCICPVESTTIKRKFITIKTDQEFDSSLKFIGSVIIRNCLGYHIFEKL